MATERPTTLCKTGINNPNALAKVNVSNHSRSNAASLRKDKMVLILSGIHLPEVFNKDIYIQEYCLFYVYCKFKLVKHSVNKCLVSILRHC